MGCYSRPGFLYHESDGGRAGREEEIHGIDGDLEVIGETHLCSPLVTTREHVVVSGKRARFVCRNKKRTAAFLLSLVTCLL